MSLTCCTYVLEGGGGGNIIFSWAGVAQSVTARHSELEGHQFDPRQSIDVCFDFPLFRVALALNTRKTEHWRTKGGKRCAPRATSLSVKSVLLRATLVK